MAVTEKSTKRIENNFQPLMELFSSRIDELETGVATGQPLRFELSHGDPWSQPPRDIPEANYGASQAPPWSNGAA